MAEAVGNQTPESTPATPAVVTPPATPVAEPESKSVSKELFDKKVSELNKQKKVLEDQLKARMTDDEKAAAAAKEQAEQFAAAQKELAALKREKEFIAKGIDPATANVMAQALSDGDMDAFVKDQAEYLEKQQKAIEENIKKTLMGAVPAAKAGETPAATPETGLTAAQKIAKQHADARARAEEIRKTYY